MAVLASEAGYCDQTQLARERLTGSTSQQMNRLLQGG